jgi:hypothetical protein
MFNHCALCYLEWPLVGPDGGPLYEYSKSKHENEALISSILFYILRSNFYTSNAYNDDDRRLNGGGDGT